MSSAAHQAYSKSRTDFAKEYAGVFVDVRNSCEEDVKLLKEVQKLTSPNAIPQNQKTIQSIRTMLSLIKKAHQPLSQCRLDLQSIITQTTTPITDQHADLFQDTDDTDQQGDDWEPIGSDEEIIS